MPANSSLALYNTRLSKKALFTPIDPNRVTMYVCGPTVYNRVHIGNARPAVVFDLLYRLLQTQYPNVVYARNITDIDDKIMRAAEEQGESITALSARYAQAYFDDMQALNNLSPDIQPYATAHIPQMIAMVEKLVEREHAYEADGHVLFAVQSMADYGKLSNRSIDDMLAGARVEVAPYKRYAGDFVLWKPSSEDEPGWKSPWGRGRPGWHLECSAMIETHLGESIDIHGGGRDLVFPHHENELAQSECAHDGKTFVNLWMHNGYINIDGEKMSKSLGNFTLVNDLLQNYAGETLRFALLSAQYRSELNFSVELLDQAKASLDSLYTILKASAPSHDTTAEGGTLPETGTPCVTSLAQEPFYQALLDDLNTPIAIRELHVLGKLLSQAKPGPEQQLLRQRLLNCAKLLGILQQSPTEWFHAVIGASQLSEADIEASIAARNAAKLNKDYAQADAIRQSLLEQGVVLEDSRDGTSWRRE
ncbi:MAG: cysteine--tRNA ligase [Pseudomonadales bacterium]|nr:cysteine--tRNA ligase [Pseudomonadales bacterium]